VNNRRLTRNLVHDEDKKLLKSINAAQRWETNITRLNALASVENARYVVFLQPTLGLLGAQSDPAPGTNDELLFEGMDKNYIANLNEFYTQIKIRCAKLTFCIDISDKVLPLGDNYNDPRHHNDKGNKILAEVIFENISALK
jgi:hypothetical protein